VIRWVVDQVVVDREGGPVVARWFWVVRLSGKV
jgi:hypothetical protein